MNGHRDLFVRAILVSPSRVVNSTVCDVLSGAGIGVEYETSATRAAAKAVEQRIPVVMMTPDTDWQEFISLVNKDAGRPSTILLLPAFDAALWAAALQAGAFEALPMQSDRDRVVATVVAAFRRWERLQLVRAALDQNPLAHSGAESDLSSDASGRPAGPAETPVHPGFGWMQSE